MLVVFFSYSHRDKSFRDELEVHLAMLKRQGIIGTWHDRRIGPGTDMDRSISEHLESADIVLLLVSPYFLDSEYCYDIEMDRAMQRHELGEARVIPVILEPCDWQRAPFGRLRATPTDGKPIAKFPNVNDAYLEVVKDIRAAAEELLRGRGESPAQREARPTESRTESRPQPRSSNLRLKREFTDRERDDFLDHSYEYIARFFENSLNELKGRNLGIDTRFRRVDATHFEASVYRQGKLRTQCRIWLSSGRSHMPGIAYSVNLSASDSSLNEILSVVDDGFTLGLNALMHPFHGISVQEHMLLEGSAEYLWSAFIGNLQ